MPTTSETGDIISLVTTGIDCVMLSCETTEGQFAVKAVKQLAKCCVEGERIIDNKRMHEDIKMNNPVSYGTVESAACSAVASSYDLKIKTILVLTENGLAARLMSKYKPEYNVIAGTFRGVTANYMQSFRGVEVLQLNPLDEDKSEDD